jgi:hypothetical protein
LCTIESQTAKDQTKSAQQDQVSELPKAKKFEVKIDGQLRPVSRASANPAAEKVSKAIETINKNKITRQPLADSNANASKRTSLESKRQSMDENKRTSVGTNMGHSVDMGNRNSVNLHNKRSSVDATKRTSLDLYAKRNSVDGESVRLEKRPSSMVQVRGGPQKPMAVMESAGTVPQRHSMFDIQSVGSIPQRHSMLDVQSAGIAQHKNSMLDVDTRGGPQKAMAVMESAGSRSDRSEAKLEPLASNPVQVRGGPQKAVAVMESAREAREISIPTPPQLEQTDPLEIRGGPQKYAAVVASARHAREGSRSSVASNRHSVGDAGQLLQRNEEAIAAKRQSHPPLNTRRSFSEGSQPAEEQPQAQNTPLVRKPSGKKTAERLAWIRELEEGNKGSGNHGRDYMFGKLQGGVRDKLARFENKQLTGGLARTDSNISRRLSTSSDAYSIEQPSINRLSRTATIDDDFRKKLEESVENQHKKRIIPQEVLDLVALTDGDQEAALNDFMENWNQDELIKQINDAADEAIKGEAKGDTKGEADMNSDVGSRHNAKEILGKGAGPADFDPFGPGATMDNGKPSEKKSASNATPVGLPKVPTTELPKPSKTWNPKPTLRSEPTRKNSVGTKSTPSAALPAAKPSWNPKITSKSVHTSTNAAPEDVEKDTLAPVTTKVPTSLLLGKTSSATGSSWNPKPSSGWNPKPSMKPAAANKQEEDRSESVSRDSKLPGTIPAKVATSSPIANGILATGSVFTAAALPKFVAT